MVPPPSPCTTREASSIQFDVANAKTAYAAAETQSPARIAGRRPRRSESLPQAGAERSWATEKAEIRTPTRDALAPKCVA